MGRLYTVIKPAENIRLHLKMQVRMTKPNHTEMGQSKLSTGLYLLYCLLFLDVIMYGFSR